MTIASGVLATTQSRPGDVHHPRVSPSRQHHPGRGIEEKRGGTAWSQHGVEQRLKLPRDMVWVDTCAERAAARGWGSDLLGDPPEVEAHLACVEHLHLALDVLEGTNERPPGAHDSHNAAIDGDRLCVTSRRRGRTKHRAGDTATTAESSVRVSENSR